MKRAISVTVASAAAVITLAACSGGGGTGTHSASTTPSHSSSSPAKPVSLPADPSLVDAKGALTDVAGLSCSANATGSWSASGTVTNTQKSAQDYAVQVNVIVTKSSTVQGRAQKTVHLAPGKSAKVSFPAFYTSKAKGLQCVPHVERAASTK
jgi:uncharacterized lipoprotein